MNKIELKIYREKAKIQSMLISSIKRQLSNLLEYDTKEPEKAIKRINDMFDANNLEFKDVIISRSDSQVLKVLDYITNEYED